MLDPVIGAHVGSTLVALGKACIVTNVSADFASSAKGRSNDFDTVAADAA